MKGLAARASIAVATSVLLVGVITGISAGSDVGKALIIGNTTQSAGTSNTALTTTSSGNAFKMQNNGSGSGLRGVATGGGNGGSFTSTNGAGNGVFAENTGSIATGHAIKALGNQVTGLYASTVRSGDQAGIIGDDLSADDQGTAVLGLTDAGVGVWGDAFDASGTGEGGLFLNSTPDDYALVAKTNGSGTPVGAAHFTGDVLVDGNVTINGTLTCSPGPCALASLALNGSGTAIRQGDALTVLGVGKLAGSRPVLMVGPARAGQLPIGVASVALAPRRITTRSLAGRTPGREMPSFRIGHQTVYVPAGTSAAAGELLLVVTQGFVAVASVDASAGPISSGDPLTLSSAPGRLELQRPVAVAGQRFFAPGASMGYALGSLSRGTGFIAVLVSPH